MTDPRETLIALYLGLLMLLAIAGLAAWVGVQVWQSIINSPRVLDETPGYLRRRG